MRESEIWVVGERNLVIALGLPGLEMLPPPLLITFHIQTHFKQHSSVTHFQHNFIFYDDILTQKSVEAPSTKKLKLNYSLILHVLLLALF